MWTRTPSNNIPPAYLYPNDEQELDRMDMQHHMLRLVNHGRLYFAPVQRPKRILDIGTGSGIWAIEIGKNPPPPQIYPAYLSSDRSTHMVAASRP